MLNLRSDRLTVVARLKAAQITQSLQSLLGEVILISSRGFLQTLLSSYYINGISHLDSAASEEFGLVVETSDNFIASAVYSYETYKVSYQESSGKLNITQDLPEELFPLDTPGSLDLEYLSGLDGYLAGPVEVNDSFYVSFTRALTKNNPDFENSNTHFAGNVIGYITMVSPATALTSVSRNLNMDDSTQMAIVGLNGNITRSQARLLDPSDLNTSFVLPTNICPRCHGYYHIRFNAPSYNALVNGTYGTNRSVTLSGVGKVAVAYAPVRQISRVWGVLIYQKHVVLYQPIVTLRVIVLTCVFSIAFGVCLVTFVLSRWVVKPITRLQAATEQSVNFPNKPPKHQRFWTALHNLIIPTKPSSTNLQQQSPHMFTLSGTAFRLPEEVVTRKYIKDELTELTETFNGMTAELRKQYNILEDRVVQRTNEIKKAKVHAETANEAKSLFIANITHELRTPLNGILGMAAVSMEETDPDSINHGLNVIFKSGELLLRLLTDLLSFSKSQVDNMKLELKGFNVSEVISQLHAIFDKQSNVAGINLLIEPPTAPLMDVELMGDMNRILQVVMNLVSNSLKFTPTGGKVLVIISAPEPKKIKKDTQTFESVLNTDLPSEITLEISVQDTGPGIAPHLQSKIFEPFVQGDLAFSEKRGGVGLGLSICSQLAKIMHGTISLQSELDSGSTFTFQVPLKVIGPVQASPQHTSTATATHTSASSTSLSPRFKPAFETWERSSLEGSTAGSEDKFPDTRSHTDLSVLIAEDNLVNQEVLVKMLKLEGVVNVKVAVDGMEAVEAVKNFSSNEKSFDIIFMDIQMPNLDGKQATEIIRRELAYKGTIIAVSAFADGSNIDDCLRVGMNDFLSKPLRRQRLRSLLMDFQNTKA